MISAIDGWFELKDMIWRILNTTDSSSGSFFLFFMTHLFVITKKKSPFVVYDFDKDFNYKRKLQL